MSFLFGLVVGCAVGALGHYSYQHYGSAGEEEHSLDSDINDTIDSLFNDFPELMDEMNRTLRDTGHPPLREFFVVDKEAIMTSSTTRLRYDLSKEMVHLLQRLEESGYIEQLEHDSLLYRIEEEFINHLDAYNRTLLGERCSLSGNAS